MPLTLAWHPDAPPDGAATAVEAEIARAGGRILACRYRLTGATGELALPSGAPSVRADGLWKSTCFELFVRTEDGGYLEFNFAPSSQWAAYRFSGYRAGMAALPLAAPPDVRTMLAAGEFILESRVDLAGVDGLPSDGPWRAGVSAVVAERSGVISYWSAGRGPGKPDFHHPDSFVVELSAQGSP